MLTAVWFLWGCVARLSCDIVSIQSESIGPHLITRSHACTHRLVSPTGAFGHPATSQWTLPPIIQLTAICGLDGVLFLMAWTAAVLATYFDVFFGPPPEDEEEEDDGPAGGGGSGVGHGFASLGTWMI